MTLRFRNILFMVHWYKVDARWQNMSFNGHTVHYPGTRMTFNQWHRPP